MHYTDLEKLNQFAISLSTHIHLYERKGLNNETFLNGLDECKKEINKLINSIKDEIKNAN